MTHGLRKRAETIGVMKQSRFAPRGSVEYAYYLTVFYGIAGDAFGVSVPLLGAGMLALLAALCVVRLGSRRNAVFAPIASLLGCAISYVVVQLVVHDEPLMGDYIRPFVTWILSLIIIQSLFLRQGFLHRFALATFVMGCTFLTFVQFQTTTSEFDRMGLDQTLGISNPNELAAWFGFCTVYFTIVGIESNRLAARVTSWLAAVGCLYVVGLTVSRGALLAVAIAATVALRRLLKRGFFPVLFLMLLSWCLWGLGVFDKTADFYAARGWEETGRFLVWPLVVERFLSSPLTGVGVSNTATNVPFSREITPHNSFLFIALASGIIPLTFFITYWWRAATGALQANSKRLADGPFRIALLSYAFLIAQTTNLPFVAPWLTATLCVASTATMPRRLRAGAYHIRTRRAAIQAKHSGEA